VYLPSNKEELVKQLIWMKHRSRDLLADERESWRRYYKMYHAQLDEKTYPLSFKIAMPWITAIVNTHIPRYVHGLIYRDPVVQLYSRHPFTSKEAVEYASLLLNGGSSEGWMTGPRTYMANVMMNKEALICGTSLGKITYDKKAQVIEVKTPIVIGGRTISYRKEKKVVYPINRPRLHNCDIWDMTMDLDHFFMDDKQWFCHSMIKEMSELEFGSIPYKNIEDIRQEGDYIPDEDWLQTRLEAVDRHYVDRQMDTLYRKPRLLDEFVVRESTREGEIIWLYAIVNEKILVREEILTVMPYVMCRHNPMPGEALGTSLIKPLERLYHGINDATNLQLEADLMELCPMWLVSESSNADLDQFVLEPMGTILTDDIEGVRDFRFKSTNRGMEKIQLLTQGLQMGASVHDYLMGVTPHRQEYSSTVMSLQNANEATIDEGIKWKEREWLSEEGRIMLEYGQHHLTDPEYVIDKNGQMHEIDMYSIQGLFGYKMMGAASGMKEMIRGAYTDFANIMSKLIGPDLPLSARLQIAEKMAGTFEGLEGVRDVIGEITNGIQSAMAPELAGAGNLGVDPNAGMAGAGEPAPPPQGIPV